MFVWLICFAFATVPASLQAGSHSCLSMLHPPFCQSFCVSTMKVFQEAQGPFKLSFVLEEDSSVCVQVWEHVPVGVVGGWLGVGFSGHRLQESFK